MSRFGSFWFSSHLRAQVPILWATVEFKESAEIQDKFCTWNLQKQIILSKNLFPPTPEGAGGKFCTSGAVGSILQVLQFHSVVILQPAFMGNSKEEHSDLWFFMYLCQNLSHAEPLRLRCCCSTRPSRFAGWSPQGGEQNLQVVLSFRQTFPALPWEAGAIPDATEFPNNVEMTWMQQTPNFLVPSATNWKSSLQFPSPDFSWLNNTPEFKHRHPSLSLPCTQSISNPWNYSWLGLEQPTWCQFYMFYKARAYRKQLKCRSYQACDPQSNQRLPETVIQGSISSLQEKWNICGPEN